MLYRFIVLLFYCRSSDSDTSTSNSDERLDLKHCGEFSMTVPRRSARRFEESPRPLREFANFMLLVWCIVLPQSDAHRRNERIRFQKIVRCAPFRTQNPRYENCSHFWETNRFGGSKHFDFGGRKCRKIYFTYVPIYRKIHRIRIHIQKIRSKYSII